MNLIPAIPEAFLRADSDKLADFLMAERAKQEMLEKLAKKRRDGKGGWHHPNQCSNAELIPMLKAHINKGDMVDVLNLAAMILMRQQMYGESTTTEEEITMKCPNPKCQDGQDQCCANPMHEFENVGKQYRKKGTQLMRPYVVGEDLTGVSVSEKDTPEEGGMMAIGKDDGAIWYVSKTFFNENYELAD